MTRTLILSEFDLEDYERDFAAGLTPTRLPYGAEILEEHGLSITGVRVPRGRVATKLREVAEHRTGTVLARPLLAVPAAVSSDLVIALLETQAVLPAELRRRHLPPYANRPLVVWSVWLADEYRRGDAATRKALSRRFANVDLLTHMASTETDLLLDLGVPQERLQQIPFGVAHRYFTPTDTPRDIEVLAVGQDRGRDYATLFAGVRGTDLTVDLVCRPENLRGLEVPDNVRVRGRVPMREYRDLLRRARVVAVPTHEMSYPTGQTVVLEAAASGAAVAVTSTPAMREYVAESTARLVGLGDARGWTEALTELRDEPVRARLAAAGREAVLATYTHEHMWAVLLEKARALGLVL